MFMTDAWLAALLDASGTAMLGVDADGNTLFWSAAAEALFGWKPSDVLGRVPPFVPATLLQEWQLQVRRVFEAGEPVSVAETQRVTRDGRTIWVVHSASPVRDADGQVIGLLDTLLDVTGLKQLDEDSRAMAQVRERELIAMDMHDGLIQSLYAVVLNLAAQEHALEFPQEDALRVLKAARAEVERVIEETRAYLFSLRARQLTPPNLAAALQLFADGLRLNAGVQVKLELDPEAERLLQAEARGHVLYLVREAVSNVLRHAAASEVRISLAQSADGVVLRVIDNGKGFDPVSRSSERHRGLHNMAARARLIDGQLRVTSRPGEGTEVCLSLPS
jgi:PAS domain S-box-containing protein